MPKTYQELIKLVKSGIEYFNHCNRSTQKNGFTPDESGIKSLSKNT